VFKLPAGKIQQLRDRLRTRGQRSSLVSYPATPLVAEAVEVVEEYGAMCEAMYLMMAADRRVLNVERQVMRGALEILSQDRVRTVHMEAMIDAAARRHAEQGEEARLRRVIESLRSDPVRAELTVVLAAVVAAADECVTPEEERLLEKLAVGLGLGESRTRELIDELLAGG
jgi:tellurite resistance protein